MAYKDEKYYWIKANGESWEIAQYRDEVSVYIGVKMGPGFRLIGSAWGVPVEHVYHIGPLVNDTQPEYRHEG